VLLTGLRIAFVQVIATATLGAYLGGGGLGRYIIDGFSVRDYTQVFAGAILVAALALLADRVLATLQQRLPVQRVRGDRRAFTRPIA
jgi:osmoprotectant transport system permease protein